MKRWCKYSSSSLKRLIQQGAKVQCCCLSALAGLESKKETLEESEQFHCANQQLTNQTRSHHQWFSAARAGDRSRVYDYTLLTLAPTSRRQSRLRRRRQFIRGLQKLLVFVPAYELQRHKTTIFACVTITTTAVSMVSDSCKSF